MKNEDLQFLKDLGTRMNMQDNRMTQYPMFQIRQKVKKYVSYDMDWDESERNFDYDGEVCQECEDSYQDGNGPDYPDSCEHCSIDCFRYFKWSDEPVVDCGNFFTAEAAQQHIDENAHHYNEPYVYGTGSWRNPELQRVLNILSNLGENGPKSHYE